MNNTSLEIDGVVIDVTKVDRLLKKLIIRERNNIKTKQYSDYDMIKNIKKLIEEEVECY